MIADDSKSTSIGTSSGLAEPEHEPEPQDQATTGDRSFESAQDDQGNERQEEDGGQVHVALLLSEHLAREAEQVAADERRPAPPRHVQAEQIGGPRGKRQQEDRRHVVGHDRPRRERQRRKDDREPGNIRRPREVEPPGRPQDMRPQRIKPM